MVQLIAETKEASGDTAVISYRSLGVRLRWVSCQSIFAKVRFLRHSDSELRHAFPICANKPINVRREKWPVGAAFLLTAPIGCLRRKCSSTAPMVSWVTLIVRANLHLENSLAGNTQSIRLYRGTNPSACVSFVPSGKDARDDQL